MLAHRFGEGEKKEILVSVLSDLRDGAFSFTTELSNSSVPSCVLKIWMSAQKWLASSHFQGKMLTFWLHASHQGIRLSEAWTSELKRTLGVFFLSQNLFYGLFCPMYHFYPFVPFQSWRGVTELTAHTHSQCGGVCQCKITDKLCPTGDNDLQAPSTGFLR